MRIVIAGRALRAGVLLAAAALALAFPPSGALPAGAAVAARSIAGPSLGPPSFLTGGAVPTVAWCGQGETADNRSPEVEVSSADQVHVVYAIPSDGADRFTSLVTPIVTDVAAIDQWWQREDPTRTPRFDLYAFPGCGTRFGMLDVTVERLPGTSASYQGEDGFRRLTGDVGTSAAGSVKTLTYYEGSHGGNVCGEAWTSPPSGGAFGVAIVYLGAPSGCGSDLGNGGRVALTAAHELTHTFGAVPSEAPNGCNGHACDSSADLMTAAASSTEGLFGKILDVNKDDYYGHSGAWWDVQDSDWLMHLPQFPITVSVVSQGGTGTVGSQPDNPRVPRRVHRDLGHRHARLPRRAARRQLTPRLLVGRLLRERHLRCDDGRPEVDDRDVRPGLVQGHGRRDRQGPHHEHAARAVLHGALRAALRRRDNRPAPGDAGKGLPLRRLEGRLLWREGVPAPGRPEPFGPRGAQPPLRAGTFWQCPRWRRSGSSRAT